MCKEFDKATERVRNDPTQCGLLLFNSTVVEGLVFDKTYGFRIVSILPCLAHNLARVFDPILSDVVVQTGLYKDTTTAQGLYRMHYYIDQKNCALYRGHRCMY